MIRKIVICAVIALILVPAGVMAAGFGGQGTGTASAQGQCLQNCQNCSDQSGTLGTGNQSQYRYGAQQNRENLTPGENMSRYRYGAQQDRENDIPGAQNGQCTGDHNQTRSMSRLHDGSCSGCTNVPVTQP